MSTPAYTLTPIPLDLVGFVFVREGDRARFRHPESGWVSDWRSADNIGALIYEARMHQQQMTAPIPADPAPPVETILVEPIAFDYAGLGAEVRIVVQQAAREIRDELDLMRQSAIKIGRRLADVRAALPRGAWGAWLSAEFGWSDQTAANYLNQATLAAQNPKFLEFEDRIDRSAMTLLAAPSTPEPAREEALARAEAGERVRHQDAREIVQAAKAEAAASAPSPSYSEDARQRQQRQATREAGAAPEPAPPAQARTEPARPSDEEQSELKAIVRQLAGSWFGLVRVDGERSQYRVGFHRERVDNYTAAQIRARAPKSSSVPAPAPLLSAIPAAPARQPYGAPGSRRWKPIVPHVLIVGERTDIYAPPLIARAATIYDTPTTVRVRLPDGADGSQPQGSAYAIPDDAAWASIDSAVGAYAQALTAFADGLRQLGRYDHALTANGGVAQVPTGPLCSSVARADDPDRPRNWFIDGWDVPRLSRASIARHTPKMLVGSDIGSYTFAQTEAWCLADDAAWQRIDALRQTAADAAQAVEALLGRLGTYDEALERAADGRTAPPAEAPVSEASVTRDAFEDRLAGLRLQVEGMGYTLRQDARGQLAIMDGAVMCIGVGAGKLDELERQIERLKASMEAKARYARAEAEDLADQARYGRAEGAARALAARLSAQDLRLIYAALAEVEGAANDDKVRAFVAETLADSVLSLEPDEVEWVLGEDR